MESTTATRSQTKRCPFCSEFIRFTAIKCRFCGEFLNTSEAKSIQTSPSQNPENDQDQQDTDNILFEARPSLWAISGSLIRGLLFLGLGVFLLIYPLENMAAELFWPNISDNQAIMLNQYRVIAGIGIAILIVLVLVLKMVKLKMTYYEVTADRIEWSRGIFDRKVDNLDMFRVVDLKLRRSLLDCILGIGTVALITTDKTDPEFTFEKVHHCRALYDVIKNASLEADRRNQVVHLE
jgi:membrane protein YdbS with pleckstrin-like domain